MLFSFMKKHVYITTFGCQMNVHDSEKMAGILEQEGYSLRDNPKDADLIIFNTCSIRQKAEQKFYSELGRIKSLKKRRPDLKIAVAGCIAQQQGRAILKKVPHVDYVFGPQNIHMLSDMLRTNKDVVAVDDNPEIAELDLPVSRKEGVRAWVSIMYGCNNFCSYCIVPYTRGRERSRPSENIYREVAGLASNGFKEVTLLGQNVNSYRSDVDFSGLLKKINSIEGIDRIRFVTSHPHDLSDDLIISMKELDRVCEHIHLPLQSGSSRILELMNRGYTYEDYRRKVERLKDAIPHISITTDIIAGFHGETDNDYMATINAVNDIEFDGIFAFKFSPRPGTRAANMEGQLSDEIKSERLSEILEIQDKISFMKNEALRGSVQEILVEGVSETDKGKLTGRTRTNKIVNFRGTDVHVGQMLYVEIVEARRHSLEGRPVR